MGGAGNSSGSDFFHTDSPGSVVGHSCAESRLVCVLRSVPCTERNCAGNEFFHTSDAAWAVYTVC